MDLAAATDLDQGLPWEQVGPLKPSQDPDQVDLNSHVLSHLLPCHVDREPQPHFL